MKLSLAVVSLSLCAAGALLAQNPVIAEQKAAYTNNKNNLIKAAEKMPEDAYSFKPTPDMESVRRAHDSHRQSDWDVQRLDGRAQAESRDGEDGEGRYRGGLEGELRCVRCGVGQDE